MRKRNEATMNGHMAVKSNVSRFGIRPNHECPEVAGPSNHLESAHEPSVSAAETTSHTPILCISLTSDDSSDDEVDVHIQHAVAHKRAGSVTENRKAIEKHSNGNPNYNIKCGHCNCQNLFESLDEKIYHMTSYHAAGVKKTFSCHLCKKNICTKRDLERHIAGLHSGRRRFKCSFPKCDKSFVGRKCLSRHTNGVHTRKIVYKCSKCPRQSYYHSNLRKHLSYAHGIGKTYFCYLCKIQYFSMSVLRKHMNDLHLPTRRIRYQCPIQACSKTFTRRDNLKTHINSKHTKEVSEM